MAKRGYPLRIDERVLAAVEGTARAQMRSVNQQLEALIREALAARGVPIRDAGPGDGASRDGTERDDEGKRR